MPLAKHTKEMATQHEKYIEELLSFDNGRRSRSSGANFADRVDVTSRSFVVECETTLRETIPLKKKPWLEVRGKVSDSRIPIVALRLSDPYEAARHIDLIVQDANEWAEMAEKAAKWDEYEANPPLAYIASDGSMHWPGDDEGRRRYAVRRS